MVVGKKGLPLCHSYFYTRTRREKVAYDGQYSSIQRQDKENKTSLPAFAVVIQNVRLEHSSAIIVHDIINAIRGVSPSDPRFGLLRRSVRQLGDK